jgi:hypothetical protein
MTVLLVALSQFKKLRCPRGQQRTARGRCGSLLLHRLKGVINVVTPCARRGGRNRRRLLRTPGIAGDQSVGGVKTAKMLAKRAGETLKRTTIAADK